MKALQPQHNEHAFIDLLVAPLIEPPHLASPRIVFRLTQNAIECGNQLTERPARLRGQNDGRMVWIVTGKHGEVKHTESDDAASQHACLQQLLHVAVIQHDPPSVRAGYVMSSSN